MPKFGCKWTVIRHPSYERNELLMSKEVKHTLIKQLEVLEETQVLAKQSGDYQTVNNISQTIASIHVELRTEKENARTGVGSTISNPY